MSSKILQPPEREYATWLAGVERTVVLPLKWVFLLLCFVHWQWVRQFDLPPTEVVALFIFFIGATSAEHYFFARDRVTPRQVRPLVFTSFLLDALFVLMLVLLDAREAAAGASATSDYLLFFVLLVLRGFALFRTRGENFAGFAIATLLFAVAAGWQLRGLELLMLPGALQKLSLVWAVMLLTQAFILLVHAQKAEERRIHERYLRSASLASLGELSAGVAHEINNPIGIIKTYAEYLEKSVPPNDPMREDFETIRSEAQRCEEIVRRMLDFSNPQVQGFESVDIVQLTRETVSFVFHSPEIAAEFSCNGPMPPVQGDPVQLKQALINILANARQILQEHQPGGGGRVRVTIGRAIGPRPPIRIEVSDNGPGVAGDDVEKLFEPFFTRRNKGTGLGLAITRRIIEAHSGSIRIANGPDGGALVTVELPIEGEEIG